MTNLIIVESPGKVKKISSLLGSGYKVVASVGHVRDLPKKELGVSPPHFTPEYEETERGSEVLAKLRKEVANAKTVFLASDPDREGESISWHLADALKLENPIRVVFSAITKKAIESALAAPREIDMAFVKAQEARRVLDRIVGYRVSSALSKRTGQHLSAGRVQSPAVRLVVDRERAIAAFAVTQHFGAELVFKTEEGASWKAAWDTKPHLQPDQQYFLDKQLAETVAAIREVTVTSFTDSEEGKAPAAPFITSTLQQVAGQKLKLRPKRTMDLAQRLYEQGAITYHRTDAPNMDQEGMENIAEYAREAGLELSDKPRSWKAKEGAQEGHEAIRPTNAADLVLGENDDERALYRLIWQRAIASQLANAIYAVRAVTLSGDANGTAVSFTGKGRTLLSPGWQAVYSDDTEKDDDSESSSNPIPALAESASLAAADGRLLTKHTKPPTRFTEATLVAEMEKMGIGRPSTYAAIIENITGRAYVTEGPKGYLIPSAVGETIRDALVTKFQFAELDYTREMEEKFDAIAQSENDYLTVVTAAWDDLDAELRNLDNANIPVANPCPECGNALSRRPGQYGFFWSCIGYPDCKVTMPDNNGEPGERKAPPPKTGFQCKDCGKELARRKGVTKPKKRGMKPRPYDFYSCTGFPKCETKYQTGEDGNPVYPADAAE